MDTSIRLSRPEYDSFTERVEALCNRHGISIKDVPTHDHPRSMRIDVANDVRKFRGLERTGDVCEWDYEEYILYLTELIDRLEWALDKASGGEEDVC